MTDNVERIPVSTTGGSYTIQIGRGCLEVMLETAIDECKCKKPVSKIIAIIDEMFYPSISLPAATETIFVSGGESEKTRESKAVIEDQLLNFNCDRNVVLVAIGGGSIGDMVGFIAATFLRGVRYIHVPTTLLAMVDSSVGGKTAVNSRSAKNMIGAFHQPHAVVVDTAFLDSLSDRLIANGMAEIIKAGFAGDVSLWTKLANDHPLQAVIVESIKYKKKIVEADEKDSGIRSELNFGHTIGHAIEMSQSSLLHGECVSIGMVYEVMCLRAIGFLEDEGDIPKLVDCLEKFNLPTFMPPSLDTTSSQFIKLLLGDKKACHTSGNHMVPIVGVKRIGLSVGESRTIGVPLSTVLRVISPFVSIVHAPGRPVSGSVIVPGSKSVANRALLLAAMSGQRVELYNVPDSVDVHIMQSALTRLGYQCSKAGKSLIISPPQDKAQLASSVDVYVGNSGTSARFLLPFASYLVSKNPHLTITFTCEPRMEERPIHSLIESLGQCFKDVEIEGLKKANAFPLIVRRKSPSSSPQSNQVLIDASMSSQFVSGMLMVLPLLAHEVTLQLVNGVAVSPGFIDMTIKMMTMFGSPEIVKAPHGAYMCTSASCGSGYRGPENFVYTIPGDAAAASYPLAISAITGCRVACNVVDDGLQGDFEFVRLLDRMGCQVEYNADETIVTGPEQLILPHEERDIDMGPMTDTFLTAAVLFAHAGGEYRLCGIANQRIKECDRITAMAMNLNKCGYNVREEVDGLSFSPSLVNEEVDGRDISPRCDWSSTINVATFNDHRVAMSMAVLSLVRSGISIENPRCIEKTFPTYFDCLVNDLGIQVAGTTGSTDCGLRFAHCLVGMRGIGKSTIGRELAALRKDSRFIDLDQEIETRYQVSVGEIVLRHGWDGFREIETAVLKDVVCSAERNREFTIVATGGGVVESASARAFLKLVDSVVWLRTCHDETTVQSATDASLRGGVPQYAQTVSETYLRRKEWYEECSGFDVYVEESDFALAQLERLSLSGVAALRKGGVFVCLTATTYIGWTRADFEDAISGPSVDAVEIRIDKLGNLDEIFSHYARIRSLLNKPVILTLRTSREGGAFSDLERYAELIRNLIRMSPDYVDIEVGQVDGNWARFLNQQKQKSNCRIIASVHSQEQPSVTRLKQAVESVVNPEWSDIGKVVFHAPNIDQHVGLEVEEYKKPLIAVCTGAGGVVSRVTNSFLTPVCSWDRRKLTAAAPGQVDAFQLDLVRKGGISGVPTRFLYHLFGSPIEKSPSPFLHNLMFAMRNLAGVCCYTARASSSVEEIVGAIDCPSFRGASVTIPLKEKVFEYLSNQSSAVVNEDAASAKSVNTLSRTPTGDVRGDNTDIIALRSVLVGRGVVPSAKCLVVGTGGAARGAIVAARSICGSVLVYGRDSGKLAALCNEFGTTPYSSDQVPPDVVIACVPSEAQTDFLKSNGSSWMSKNTLIVEMAYVPKTTPLIELALAKEAHVVYGSEILLLQAIEQHRIWVPADSAPVLDESLVGQIFFSYTNS